MSLESGQTLSHYRLIETIGEGGMGVVWKAQDTVLKRTVAIKVLPADFARDEERREMFLREARLASSVSEAHVVQVYEFGREGGLDFIVMEYVEGEPLKNQLHARSLPPHRVVELGYQVAQALSRAHRKGLVHRDLKPGNILVTPDGDVKVVDFGLATLLGHEHSIVDSEVPTRSEIDRIDSPAEQARIAGTLPYMSPEQARGEQFDARSDIFSFGVVLYEMTAGQRPFRGTTATEVREEILKARPKPPHELVSSVPLDLDRIIRKALARSPADRYQTMDDLAVDLKRLGRDLELGSSPSYEDLRGPMGRGWRLPSRRAMAAGVLVVVVLGAAALWLASRTGRGTADAGAVEQPRSILVLPLEVRGQTEGADYLGRAFADAVAHSLAQAKDLRVLPVPEPGELGAAGELDRARAAREVGADQLLTGSLNREGDVVRASLKLLDATQNRILWGVQSTTTHGELPTLASSLAQEVATYLGVSFPKLYDYVEILEGGPEMAASPYTAEALGAFRRDDEISALQATRQLVEDFPGEPAAHALHAYAQVMVAYDDPSPSNRMAAEQALESLERVDPATPYAEIFRATQALFFDGQLNEAIERYTRVLSRSDLTAAARAWVLRRRAAAETMMDDTAAALEDLEQALRLDPVQPETLKVLSATLREAGRLEEALVRAGQAVALNPSSWGAHVEYGLALSRMGRWSEAALSSGKACELSQLQPPCSLYAIDLLGSGQGAEASQVARESASLPDSKWGTYNLACYWSLAGDRDRAILFLRRSLDLGFAHGMILRDPDLDSLRGEPEFEAVVAEVKRRIGQE